MGTHVCLKRHHKQGGNMRLFRYSKQMLRKVGASAAALALFATPAYAAADPITGLDVEALITTAILGIGVLVGAALAGYFAFKIIKIGLRWFGRSGG